MVCNNDSYNNNEGNIYLYIYVSEDDLTDNRIANKGV